MKKTLLLAAAALFAASSSFATTYNVVGSDVNGASWDTTSGAMTEKSATEYEWTGASLGSEFKIVLDGAWANNLASNGSKVTLGTPYSYTQPADGGDNIVIDIASNSYLANAKVVLDLTAKTITVTGTETENAPVDPNEVTFYMIGDNVNGHNWELAAADCAFTSQGNGIYRWEGEILGTGFKINDGTWSNGDYNIGSSGMDLTLDAPYYYVASSSSGNIGFADVTEVANPVVVLNINEGTITVSGEGAGEASWYIMGLNDNWDFIEAYQLQPVEGEDGVFVQVVKIVQTSGELKISDNGWAHERGTNNPDEVMITPDILEIELDEVYGEAGNVSYELPEGTYLVTWDENEFILTFSTEVDGVQEIVMTVGGKTEYFNLQGQKVANPDKGIYVKVVDGKATKIVK